MLTPSDLKKIENFHKLTPGHRRVFKHRTKKKCENALWGFSYLLSNLDTLKFKAEDVIKIELLHELVETYEKSIALRNM